MNTQQGCTYQFFSQILAIESPGAARAPDSSTPRNDVTDCWSCAVDAMSSAEIMDRLQLYNLKGHRWHIQEACAKTGEGVFEAMATMSQLVKDLNKNRRAWSLIANFTLERDYVNVDSHNCELTEKGLLPF